MLTVSSIFVGFGLNALGALASINWMDATENPGAGNGLIFAGSAIALVAPALMAIAYRSLGWTVVVVAEMAILLVAYSGGM